MPLLLDAGRDYERTQAWLNDRTASEWSGSDADANFNEHVRFAFDSIADTDALDLGPHPDDLLDVLTLMAVAGPGNLALRTIGRMLPHLRGTTEPRLAAAKIAWAFRAYFNGPEPTALIRGSEQHEGPYWRQILQYCANGNLESVLDEYAHVLWEANALDSAAQEGALSSFVDSLEEVLTLRTVTLRVDTLAGDSEDDTVGLRGSFALPYGDIQDEPGQEKTRADQVRSAFNSPFLPHILVSTSVGQEGLDFHPYCHSVVHWNLPSNPVDLEQREGRVHRYKNHAVRKNVAHRASVEISDDSDPWQQLFTAAEDLVTSDSSGVSPFWIFEGPHSIERRVPALPLSREIGRLEDLRRSLAIYRMVFGQVRQDDLLDYLQSIGDVPDDVAEALKIDLEPPGDNEDRATRGR